MARRDVRALRDTAATAASEGKHRKALACYLELEQLELNDPNWPKRAAETYRRVGKNREAIAAYDRAVDRYVQGGFLVQAIAVCKVILQIDPGHDATKQRLASISEQQGSRRTQAGALADRHSGTLRQPTPRPGPRIQRPPPPEPAAAAPPATPVMSAPAIVVAPPPADLEASLGDDQGPMVIEPTSHTAAAPVTSPPAVLDGLETIDELSLDEALAAERGSSGIGPDAVSKSRTITGPIRLDPGAPLDSVTLAAVPGARAHRKADGSASGIIVIPIDDEGFTIDSDDVVEVPSLEIEAVTVPVDAESLAEIIVEPAEDPVDLAIEDLEDLAEPRPYSAAARRALESTPLFASLPPAAMEQLIERLALVELAAGQVLFREGDAGDALYIVADGAVTVHSEGPPRQELACFGPGAFFGEVALVTEAPRSATVTAETETQLLAVDREAIRMLMGEFPDVLPVLLRFLRERLVDRLVRTHPLFESFGDADREYLVSRFRFLEIEAGSTIVNEGGRPAGLYALLAGRAEVTTASTVLATLGSGELFGEVALLTGEASRVTIRATARCLALCMPSSDFREIIMTHPQVLSYVGDLADERRWLQAAARARVP